MSLSRESPANNPVRIQSSESVPTFDWILTGLRGSCDRPDQNTYASRQSSVPKYESRLQIVRSESSRQNPTPFSFFFASMSVASLGASHVAGGRVVHKVRKKGENWPNEKGRHEQRDLCHKSAYDAKKTNSFFPLVMPSFEDDRILGGGIRVGPKLRLGLDSVLWKVSLWSIFVVQSSGSSRGTFLQMITKWGGAQPPATQPKLRSKMGISKMGYVLRTRRWVLAEDA